MVQQFFAATASSSCYFLQEGQESWRDDGFDADRNFWLAVCINVFNNR
jgi:hypothetical protein